MRLIRIKHFNRLTALIYSNNYSHNSHEIGPCWKRLPGCRNAWSSSQLPELHLAKWREKEKSTAATLRNMLLAELWVMCTSLHIRGNNLHMKTRCKGLSRQSTHVFTLSVTFKRPTSGTSTWWHLPLTVTALFYHVWLKLPTLQPRSN